MTEEEISQLVDFIGRLNLREMTTLLQLVAEESSTIRNEIHRVLGKIIRKNAEKHRTIVQEKLRLVTPHGGCQCKRCSKRTDPEEDFCCKSHCFVGYNLSRDSVCVTENEVLIKSQFADRINLAVNELIDKLYKKSLGI